MSGWYRKRHCDGAKNEKTTFSYPNTSGHWLRNLSHRNARLKMNSMDGLSGMAYAEVADWTRSSQTIFILLDDSRRVIYIKLIRGVARIPRKLEANLLLLGLVSQNGSAWLQAVVIKGAKAAPLLKQNKTAFSPSWMTVRRSVVVWEWRADSSAAALSLWPVKKHTKKKTVKLQTLNICVCDPAWNAETLSIGGRKPHMYQVHFWNSLWFLNELGPCFASATRGQALTVLCASSTKVCLNGKGDGNKRCLSSGCSANTDSARGHCARRRDRPTLLALQTLPAVQSELPVRAHVLMHLCPSITAVTYKYGATPWVNALCLTFTGM